MPENKFIVVDPADNVATAIIDLDAGARVIRNGDEIVLAENIPFGHKFALVELSPGDYVVKYGARIGRVTRPIARGDHVHVHNVQDIVDEVRKDHENRA